MISAAKRSKLLRSTALYSLYRAQMGGVMPPETFDNFRRQHIRFVVGRALFEQIAAANAARAAA